MNDILNLMMENTYTLPDLKHRLRILKEYLEAQVFSKNTSLSFDPEDSAWLNSLPSGLFSQFNKDNLPDIFTTLEQTIDKISPLTLYLSFEPNKEIVSAISAWLRQNLSQKPILEIKFDPGLIGGCALVKDGIYKDYSLKARIEEQKEVILTEFKKYIS